MDQIPLKPQDERFTDDQWQAIFGQGDNLLVPAPAGPGRTTVLVRRVTEKLKMGSDIGELLTVIFTEAAARETKEGTQEALQESVNNRNNPIRGRHFIKQLVLLPIANISTLYAFRLTVIRRYYYLIDIDPVFHMLTNEIETILMKEDVWDGLGEAFYTENDERFFQLTMSSSNDYSGDGLTNLVFSLYEFARVSPDPQKRLGRLNDSHRLLKGLAKPRLYQKQICPLVLADIHQCVQLYEQVIQLAQGEGLEKIYEQVAGEQQQVENVYEVFSQDRLEEAYAGLEQLASSTFESNRRVELKEISNEIKSMRDKAKKLIQQISKGYFPVSPNQMEGLVDKALPLIEEMTKITQSFMGSFSMRRREEGMLGFNDLKHLALQVLTEKMKNIWLPSGVSKHYQKNLKK